MSNNDLLSGVRWIEATNANKELRIETPLPELKMRPATPEEARFVHPMDDAAPVYLDLLKALRDKNAELEKRIDDLEDQLRAVWGNA